MSQPKEKIDGINKKSGVSVVKPPPREVLDEDWTPKAGLVPRRYVEEAGARQQQALEEARRQEALRNRRGKFPQLTEDELEEAGVTPLDLLVRWQNVLPRSGVNIREGLPDEIGISLVKIVASHGAFVQARMDEFDPELEAYTVPQFRRDIGTCRSTYGASMANGLKNMKQLYLGTKRRHEASIPLVMNQEAPVMQNALA